MGEEKDLKTLAIEAYQAQQAALREQEKATKERMFRDDVEQLKVHVGNALRLHPLSLNLPEPFAILRATDRGGEKIFPVAVFRNFSIVLAFRSNDRKHSRTRRIPAMNQRMKGRRRDTDSRLCAPFWMEKGGGG
jgi:hypothetical protein